MSKKFSKFTDDDYYEKENRKKKSLKRKNNRQLKHLEKFKTFRKDD